MKKGIFYVLILLGITASDSYSMPFITDSSGTTKKEIKADAPDAGLTLPKGFQATEVANDLGKARHITVTKEGNMYVKLASGKQDNAIIYLSNPNANGKFDSQKGFGTYRGTGITIKNGFLYASSDDDIYRYKLNEKGEVINPGQPEKIVSGLVNRRMHESKSIVLDNDGNIYVNIGAYSNNCQEKDRTKGSPGMQPCPILDSAGGIWEFKADKPNQTYSDGSRYATGLRNVVGLDWNTQANQLFVMQHGRD